MMRRFEVVEEDCISCGLCSERAPENFEIPKRAEAAQIFKQPETSDEEEACLEACDYCPMGGVVSTDENSPPGDSSEGGA